MSKAEHTHRLDPVDPDHYRKAFGRWPTGVSVVTTRVGRVDHAMTVNSLTSISLDPILMMISVEREARFYDAVMEAGAWAVSLLPASARQHAVWLSTRGRPLHGQLDRVPHHPGEATGMAVLDDALAEFECRTTHTLDAGDHTIVVGQVVGMAISDDPQPALTYFRGAFGSLD